ncbi:hypothetical protein JB92DRAFT_1453918 [Gautieria morchelliformis]|nr:hypothetical protein JB92DRAFT_1453918 [Gautieria morchelliformis]
MASRSKSKSTMPDFDEVPLLSQPSSDDGVAAALIQKMHSTTEKRRKERDARYLKTYRKETLEINARSTLGFNDCCDEIEKAFADFFMAYAKSEDEIRATWVKIVKAHEPFTVYIREQIAAEIQQEKEREDRQLLGIAYHKKSEESLDRIIESLLKNDLE